MARRGYDTYVHETERWTLNRPSKNMGDDWGERIIYSITDRGTYCQITFITPEGKKLRGGWSNSGLTSEKLEGFGFKLTKRRKPKRINIK